MKTAERLEAQSNAAQRTASGYSAAYLASGERARIVLNERTKFNDNAQRRYTVSGDLVGLLKDLERVEYLRAEHDSYIDEAEHNWRMFRRWQRRAKWMSLRARLIRVWAKR